MKGDEFVKKILNGERDFSYIKLEEGFDFNKYKGFKYMQQYLKNKYLQGYPIIINFSDFSGIKAQELHLPYLKGEKASFRRAKLDYADFSYSSLKCANFEKASLIGAWFLNANLEGVNFERAYLIGALLHRANLRKAKLMLTNLGKASICEADLKEADLEYASLLEAIINLSNFEGSNLKGADFEDVLADGAINFKKTDLKKENFGKIKKFWKSKCL